MEEISNSKREPCDGETSCPVCRICWPFVQEGSANATSARNSSFQGSLLSSCPAEIRDSCSMTLMFGGVWVWVSKKRQSKVMLLGVGTHRCGGLLTPGMERSCCSTQGTSCGASAAAQLRCSLGLRPGKGCHSCLPGRAVRQGWFCSRYSSSRERKKAAVLF